MVNLLFLEAMDALNALLTKLTEHIFLKAALRFFVVSVVVLVFWVGVGLHDLRGLVQIAAHDGSLSAPLESLSVSLAACF